MIFNFLSILLNWLLEPKSPQKTKKNYQDKYLCGRVIRVWIVLERDYSPNKEKSSGRNSQ